MPITRDMNIGVDASDRINKLARAVSLSLHGKPKVECELALLLAYCNVADGVQQMPAGTRSKRASLIVSKASTAICEIIEQVAALNDAQFDIMAPTCRE